MEVLMMEGRKAYEEKLDAQLKEWKSRITVLKAKADTKTDYDTIIQALEHKQDEAMTKLRELKTAGDEAWEDHKSGFEKVLDAFQTAFHGAAENFK
jgi:hypothetical protein